MFSCLRWCFGGRLEDEAEKGRDDFAANLEAEHQQISHGIAARLATADAVERIRIRDMLRDGEKGTTEWKEEEKKEEVMMEKEERARGRKLNPEDVEDKDKDKDKDSTSTSTSNATRGSSRAPQLRVLSPMPLRISTAAASGLEPPMTADLRPVLTDLPDATAFAVGLNEEE